MVLTDGFCGLRRDNLSLFSSLRCSLRPQEARDTVAQFVTLTSLT